MSKSTTETYNLLAKTYEKDIDMDSPFNADYERPAMMKQIPERLSGVRVLDAGCSAGWYSEALADRGANVTGIDISKEMINTAKRRLKGKAAVLCHDLEKALPFPDHEFDIIVSSLTLHYLKDWENTFTEFQRVLKPNGMFLFSTHHPFMDFTRFNCDNYFQKNLLIDKWNKPGITIDVQFYRRALQDIISVTSHFFSIEKLIEPQPEEAFKEKNPDSYHYLMTNPHFLIIQARVRN
nr:class I SAM-dependent methyltransferase [Metabacillus arenae]